MVLADKNKVDDFIKEYIIINSRIKIAKAKIRHAEYQNNKFTVLKNKKILHELESIKSIVDNNISNGSINDYKNVVNYLNTHDMSIDSNYEYIKTWR